MTIRPLLLGTALMTVAVVAGGCHGSVRTGVGSDRPLAVRDRLDCPESEGRLRRVDAAADGRSCRYTGPDGQEVLLSYVALDGRTPQQALAPIEAGLRELVPAAAAPEPGSLQRAVDVQVNDEDGDRSGDGDDKDARRGDDARWSDGSSDRPVAPRKPDAPDVDPGFHPSRHHGERVKIDLPFLHIDADGSGRARVRAFGADVDANDEGAVVKAGFGGSDFNVNAHHGGAEMRFGAVGEKRADLTYIVASDTAGPQGWKAAALVAKGPTSGPLVAATGRSREERHGRHDDGDIDDLKSLVNRNVRSAR